MRRHNYLVAIFTVILFLAGQNPAMAFDNPNKSYFVFSPDGKHLARLFQTRQKTWIKVQETGGMKTVAQWQVPDFKPHTVRFSPHDSNRLLLADPGRYIVYDLKSGKPDVVHAQTAAAGQTIVSADFDQTRDHLAWATPKKVFRTNLQRRQDRRIADIEKDDGTIKSMIPLANGKLAVILKGSNKVLLFSPESPLFAEELNGHRSPVVGIASPDGNVLISVGADRTLLIWDINRLKIIQTLNLGKPSDGIRVKGVSLDEPRRHLLVQTFSDPEGIGQRYAIADLLKGYVDPDKQPLLTMKSGNIYSTSASVSGDKGTDIVRPVEKSKPVNLSPYKPKQKNSFYDLAKIEADNENYEAALDFIRRIPLDDPQYKQSRELQKRVRNQMAVKADLDAALQEYRRGNLEAARIQLENILARNPGNKQVERYLDLVESKMSKGAWLKLLLTLLILILLGLLGYLAWKYKEIIRKKIGVPGEKDSGESKEKKIVKDRREFIIRLEETKKMLKKAVALDRSGKYKDKWLEFSGTLTNIEKRAKVKDKFLVDLGAQLTKMQQKILKLAPGARLPGKKPATADATEEKKAPAEAKPKAQKAIAEEPKKKTKPDYYQVLEIKKDATADQIKKAYHKKMKEYHPDKHNASDFDWVKDEAARMTSLVQEAYDVLSDPKKRKQYQP